MIRFSTRILEAHLGHLTANGRLLCPIAALLLVFCQGVALANTLELIRKIPHSGYSEGLTYHDGFLWNALPKKINKIRPSDGEVVESFAPGSEYSESIEWFSGKLFNLSFSDNGIYVSTPYKGKLGFKREGTMPEEHGWGLTHNGKELVATGNYSKKFYFLDPKTLKVLRTLETEVPDAEDLAWDGEYLWSSSFTQERGFLYRVDTKTGKAEKFQIPEPEKCPVVDGLAYDGSGLWITGKECPSIWKVKLPKSPLRKK